MSMYENIGMTSLDYIEEILHLRKALADVSDECSKAYDKIANLEQQRWVSVKDRLPDKDYLYIVCRTFAGHQIVFAALWENKKFISVVNHNPLEYITHWMLLPEPPDSEDDA